MPSSFNEIASDSEANSNLSSRVNITPEQIGRKIGKHSKDFGLDPSNENDRKKFVEITKDILEKHDEKRRVKWRGQEGEVIFYAKGKDVVTVNEKGDYVTTLKDGVTNKRSQGATII